MQKGLRVLVTGASSGLGKEIAIQLARRGARVAITGRRQDKLSEAANAVEAAGGECLPLLGSVTELAEVKAHYAEIKQRWGGLDWAILNAGVGDSENARNFSAEKVRWTFETNVFGVANWLEAVLPDMIAAGAGTVAAVSSLASFRGLPGSGAYSASKAAVSTLMESTRVDLRGTGVDVVIVTPGFVKSELTARNNPKEMAFLMETADGVRCLLDGIEKKKRIVHFPWQLSYLMKYVVARLPGWVYDPIIARARKRTKKPYVDESKQAKAA